MSPLALRRYRAERLLRQEFEALRNHVLESVRARLRTSGVSIDAADLDACYATAWQGLYTTMLTGQEIVNPAGWLVLVTFRRAIEEHRTRRRLHADPSRWSGDGGEQKCDHVSERDLPAEIDDRRRLMQLFEGLRGRLSAREREAAVLCYLQGLSRAEAASRIGISEARMRKLMDGSPGRPGVAGKVGAIVEAIREGDWCEEQSSLMRGLAFGILDPGGERYRLALLHRRECPACRAYVLSLRELAVTLPPVFLPAGLGAGALALVAGSAHGVAGVGAPAAGGAAAGGATAGGATAGGSWMMAGGAGVKLVVGCVLAVGVGAGCVGMGIGAGLSGHSARGGHEHGRRAVSPAVAAPPGYGQASGAAAPSGLVRTTSTARSPKVAARPAPRQPAGRPRSPSHGAGQRITPPTANREFTPEQATAAAARSAPSPRSAHTPTGRESAEREFSPG